jgi:hypothetical protein
MEEYYRSRPRAEPTTPPPTPTDSTTASPTTASASVMSEFDRFRLSRITEDSEEGWASELRRYLKEIPADVTKDTDIVAWWQVLYSILIYFAS